MADVESTYQKLIGEIKQICPIGILCRCIGLGQTDLHAQRRGRASRRATRIAQRHDTRTCNRPSNRRLWLAKIENSDLISDPLFRSRNQRTRTSPGLRSGYQTAPVPRRRTRPRSHHRAASMARSPRKIGLRPVPTPPHKDPRPETSTSKCAEHGRNILRHAIRRL